MAVSSTTARERASDNFAAPKDSSRLGCNIGPLGEYLSAFHVRSPRSKKTVHCAHLSTRQTRLSSSTCLSLQQQPLHTTSLAAWCAIWRLRHRTYISDVESFPPWSNLVSINSMAATWTLKPYCYIRTTNEDFSYVSSSIPVIIIAIVVKVRTAGIWTLFHAVLLLWSYSTSWQHSLVFSSVSVQALLHVVPSGFLSPSSRLLPVPAPEWTPRCHIFRRNRRYAVAVLRDIRTDSS